MHSTEGSQHFEGLNCQFASRDDEERSETIIRGPPLLEEPLNYRQKVAEGLAGAGTGTNHDVSACDTVGDSSALDICKLHEFGFEEP